MLHEEEEEVLHRFEHELSHRQLELDLYLKMRKMDKEDFIKQEVTPTAITRLERALVMEALSKKYGIKVSNDELEQHISSLISDLVRSGELHQMQKDLGEKKFANAISHEAANRALESAIRLQLRKIASPESFPAEEPKSEGAAEPTPEAAEQAEAAE